VDEGDSRGPDGPDETTEIDLRDRLRFAAGALAADLGDQFPFDLAEALVFSSAQGLLVSASVTEFVPILAERRARLALRSAAAPPTAAPVVRPPPDDGPWIEPAAPSPAPPAGDHVASAPANPVAPLLAVPDRELARLRAEVERARTRLAEWRAEQGRRDEPAT